ncbi:hypothetical protein T07_1054, partial [Trichinella nelsoni]
MCHRSHSAAKCMFHEMGKKKAFIKVSCVFYFSVDHMHFWGFYILQYECQPWYTQNINHVFAL